MDNLNFKSLFRPRMAVGAVTKALKEQCVLSRAGFDHKQTKIKEELHDFEHRLEEIRSIRVSTLREKKDLYNRLDKLKTKKAAALKKHTYVSDEMKRIKKLPLTKLQVTRPVSPHPEKKIVIPPQILAVTSTLYTEKSEKYEENSEKEMGKYAIILDFAQQDRCNQIRAINLTQRVRQLYDHPCIENTLSGGGGSICFGNIAKKVRKAWEELRFFDIFDLVIDLICSPLSVVNPRIYWDTWFDEVKKPGIREIKTLMKNNLQRPINMDGNGSELTMENVQEGMRTFAEALEIANRSPRPPQLPQWRIEGRE